jgi:hypothetical protein
MSTICNFGQLFQIINIFYFRMLDKNHKIYDILVSHF